MIPIPDDDDAPVFLTKEDMYEVFPNSRPRKFDIEIPSKALKPVNTLPKINTDIVKLTCGKCGLSRDVDLNVGFNLNNVWVGIRYICGCGSSVELKDNQLKLT